MIPTDPVFKTLAGEALKGRIARRLITWTVVFSGLLALLITVAQLLIEYRRDVQVVDERFTLIEQSYLGSVVDNVWVADRERLATLLSGIIRLPDFAYAEVRVEGRTFVHVGTPVSGRGLTKHWPLLYSYRGSELSIGELHVGADLASARQRFIERAWFIVLANFAKTLLVAGFLFLLVHYLITRHLERISRYAVGLSVEHLDVPLVLDRQQAGGGDEIDRLAGALNLTRERLRDSYDELLELNQNLEGRVAARTAELSHEIEERRRHELALAQSEGQLRAVFDAALVGIIVADEGGKILVFNPAASELFGYRTEEMIGANVSSLMPAEHARQHDAYLQRYLQSGVQHIIGMQREMTGRRKDGSQFPMRLAVSESRVGDRRLFIGMVQDLTERRRFEEALVAAKLMAEEANTAKSEFLSRMSHELRTPLNAILGFAQLLASDPREPLSESQRDSVSHILQGGAHLLELINEVLDLAKIESGKLDLSDVPVDIIQLVSNCLRMMAPGAEQAGITLHSAEMPGALAVYGDQTRLRQCLLNLLSNAIKYNKPGGEVCVTMRRDEGLVHVEVRDTGIGFDKDAVQRLFQPFSRLHAREFAVEGTGIGLALTRRLVELMGGKITASGEPGIGSTFTLTLRAAGD